MVVVAATPVRAQRVTLGPPDSWSAAARAGAAAPASFPRLASTGDPALDYTLNCQGCHRAKGRGSGGGVPRLAGSMARFLSAEGGRDYLARVPGVAQSVLDDAALARLLNWMLARFDAEHVPADFRPYLPDEMASLRRRPLVRAAAARERLLRAIDADARVTQ
jgi:cytochrome c553